MHTSRHRPLRHAPVLAALLALLVASSATAGDAHHHETLDCRRCHELGRSTVDDPTPTCAGCHGPGSSRPWGSAAFHGTGERACTDCHSFHEPGRVTLPGRTEHAELSRLAPAGSQDGATACGPCHGDTVPDLSLLTAAHRAAADWYHANMELVTNQTVTESCLRCHDHQQELPAELADGWDPPRPHTQASHPYLVEVTGDRGGGFRLRTSIDPRLELIEGRIECTTCHDIFRHENDMLVAFESHAALCTGCHARNAPRGSDTAAVLAR